MKAVWEMSRDEWLSEPRTWQLAPREMTLEEWRHQHGFHNPLDDHGDFRFPNGITQAVARRRDERFAERARSMAEGARQFEELKATGQVPQVTEERHIYADGLDTDRQLASARVYHRTQVTKAVRAGERVPAHVLADYPQLPGRNLQAHFSFDDPVKGAAA